MKRLTALLAVLCLLLGCFTVAQAAKYTITLQPETQTVKKGGNVTFKVKATNVGSDTPITWYFTNPATGEVTTGKKLSTVVKGVKVQNPNSQTMTLKKVPEELHGWTLYCRVGPKSGGVNSDTAMILISGMDTPDGAPAPAEESAPAEEEPAPAEEEPAPAEDESGDETAAPAEETGDTAETPADDGTEVTAAAGEEGAGEDAVRTVVQTVYATPAPEPIVIKASKLELYELDRNGKIKGEAQTELNFPAGSSANFYVKLPEETEGTIGYLLLDDVRLTPEGDVTGMSVRGWKTSAGVRVKLKSELTDTAAAAVGAAAVEEDVDESSLVTITCVNCRFTGWHNTYAETGKVPAGSTIQVMAAGGLLKRGYAINGAKPEYKNMAAFSLVVEEDTTIEMTVDESWSKSIKTGATISDEEE